MGKLSIVEDCLHRMVLKLDGVQPLNYDSHIPGQILVQNETELMIGEVYVQGQPVGYPSTTPERVIGARNLRHPTNATYLNMPLRLGITTLHIRDVRGGDNIEALLMVYMGGGKTNKIPGDPSGRASVTSVEGGALILLLENGVVSSTFSHMNYPVCVANSWYPKGMERYGGGPYPRNLKDVEGRMVMVIDGSPFLSDFAQVLKKDRAFKSIPDLVMLAIDTYKEVAPPNARPETPFTTHDN